MYSEYLSFRQPLVLIVILIAFVSLNNLKRSLSFPSFHSTSRRKFGLAPSRFHRTFAGMRDDNHQEGSNNNKCTMNASVNLFGKFIIPEAHIFYRSSSSFAFVNLRPIVPRHVLVVPQQVTQSLSDLSEHEYLDLWKTVRMAQRILTRYYYYHPGMGTPAHDLAFNVAVQDGPAAGQTVPHVHVHILPRFPHDFERNDDVYDMLQEWAPLPTTSNSKAKLVVPDDSDRKDRTTEEMAQEAAEYRRLVPF